MGRCDRAVFMAAGIICSVCLVSPAAAAATASRPAGKTASALYPPRLIAAARSNAAKFPWAAGMRDRMVAEAEPWLKLSDEHLWSLMFGNTIKRSWMVWSNGHCPSCEKTVPMYNWQIKALQRPWKVCCPHCRELFPKNDFHAFYRSGLDESGVFRPERADRTLLFNAEHPDPKDPLHTFGVDDGEGFAAGGKRWRFIGAYLIYGQWKQAIVEGIFKLAAAYVATGDSRYAHKAAILLDRVADLYPTFDFAKEGVLYEGPPSAGYISTWHDACIEVRQLALAYDQIFDVISDDVELVTFLAAKAQQHKLSNPKGASADIRRNIEDRILRDTLANRPKIESNYPSTDVTLTLISTVLEWPANREAVLRSMDAMIATATAIDGVSGEKGLDGYAAIAPQQVGALLGLYARGQDGFLAEMLLRHPRLHAMFRFHIDTWCLERYYPRIGDTGNFAVPSARYDGLWFTQHPGTAPSSYQFLWDMYTLTGDADFVRILDRVSKGATEGLPYDLFASDPAAFQEQFRAALAKVGRELSLPSVNKQQWRLGILRGGRGRHARAAWLDYDSGERHSHRDGLNIGLFAFGLDLLPDFGYPPVHYGGWGSPRATWYTMTAAHNTVVVDGASQAAANGTSTLWAEGRSFRAIRASAPAMIGGRQYERTLMMVDADDQNSYLADIFRVAGGAEHVKFVHGPFGEITTTGLSLRPAADYGRGTHMRNFRCDPRPKDGWSADWKIEDRLDLLDTPGDYHLRYIDLTPAAEAMTAESWVSTSMFKGTGEAWLPTVAVKRSGAAPLASTFVSIYEPYERRPFIEGVQQLLLSSGQPGDTAIEVRLVGGGRDVIIARDPGQASVAGARLEPQENRVRLEGDMCWVRFNAAGEPVTIAACHTRSLEAGELSIQLEADTDFFELSLAAPAAVLAGKLQGEIRYRGNTLSLK